MGQNQGKFNFDYFADQISNLIRHYRCTGLSMSSMAYLAFRLFQRLKRQIVIIAASPQEAEKWVQDLGFFFAQRPVSIFTFLPYHLTPHTSLSYHNETAAARIRTLYQMMTGEAPIIVTSTDACLQRLVPKNRIAAYAELVMEYEEVNREDLISKLISGGYVRTAITEEPGDFSIRGGILDVFSPIYPDPIRMELDGNRVISLRFFSAATQRKKAAIPEAILLPAREAILNKESMDGILTRIRKESAELEIPLGRIRELTQQLKNMEISENIEGLIPLIYGETDNFLDYVSKEALVVLPEPEALEKAAATLHESLTQSYLAAQNEGRLCMAPESLFLPWEAFEDLLKPLRVLRCESVVVSTPENGRKDSGVWRFSVEENPGFGPKVQSADEDGSPFLPVIDWIRGHIVSGRFVRIACAAASDAGRLESLLTSYGIWTEISAEFHASVRAKDRKEGDVVLCLGRLTRGFTWPDEALAVITEEEIFGKKHRKKIRHRQLLQSVRVGFEDLKQGDLIVHDDHGIGRYEGLVKLGVEQTINDYLLLVYKGEDKLYLPVERMAVIQKYLGVDGVVPMLDTLGGKSWERVKERVKKSAEKIAGELLKLYAARSVKEGHAFQPADSRFQDFESAFPYEETQDQMKAISDAFDDMASSRPMDRLICGDVGYGKTEVALRASYMAVNDGKQVAVLVPTTVLAEQHLETFSKRFEDFPVFVTCLSRFRTLKEQKRILEDVASGKIDIVIGTHRLLQKDVQFKDLGLLIVDEEQRFGVRHKERLKTLKTNVDVLSLTATPIPRTLHMSLTGVRDISLIATPPEHRYPIVTYVSEMEDGIIAEAIRKELKRGGQIFFVHNNIHGIWKMARHLQDLVPEVRLGVAHGRMKEKELEAVMLSFMRNEIDMLLSTAIIESGLDIPSANTILIHRADRFGLAQIYQLRGRVGRTDQQAYAYLFVPKGGSMTANARKRLKVLMEHSDLGSGFQIAMRDLEIRGGGSILGASQSGHIAAVGYDMFLQLMENAVAQLKGEPIEEPLQPEINMGLSAFIPETYVSDIDQRLSIYRRLSRMDELKEVLDFKAELSDRFGNLPVEGSNLMLKIVLKILAAKAGVRRLDLNGDQLMLHFSKDHMKDPPQIAKIIQTDPARFSLTSGDMMRAVLLKEGKKSPIIQTRNLLKTIAEHVNFATV